MNNQNCVCTHRGVTFLRVAKVPVSVQFFPFFFIAFLLLLQPGRLRAQAVTSIITDYNGYWKSSSTVQNSTRPTHNHNLLAFTYNGVLYSTGVNDELLYRRGEKFSAADFWSLPVGNITGTIDGSTKIGVGALFDGVDNGSSNPPPENDLIRYLTDGIKGLNIGTCVANLPVGAMYFSVHSIKPSEIGDGKPDIVVTQVADPSGDYYDRYEFTDANGNRIGTHKDIVFTSINPVGTWTADFYEASKKPMTLVSPFIQTNRPIRLWAADLSEFGLNRDNIHLIRNFKINLCGRSDVAFVAYNKNGMDIGVLPVRFTGFKGVATPQGVVLNWQTGFEKDNSHFVVERSTDGVHYNAIATVAGKGNSNSSQAYGYTDQQPLAGVVYYRIRQVDHNGVASYSTVVQVKAGSSLPLQAYPNPGNGFFRISHPKAVDPQPFRIYNAYGALVGFKAIAAGAQQTSVDLRHLPAGQYYILWQQGGVSQSLQLSKQ